MFVALSCLQGRPSIAAFDELARLAHDFGAGIQLTPGNEVTLRGFTPEATRESLKKLLAATPVRSVKLVASRHYTPAAVDAEYLSRDGKVVT